MLKKNLGFIAILGLTAILLLAAFSVLSLYNRPLGPALNLDLPPAASTPTGKPNQASAKTCGARGVMNLMLLGQASPIEDGHYGADAVRLARIDFDQQSVAILALPSDLWVGATALDDPDIESVALNQIYQMAYEAAPGNEPEDVVARKATEVLAQAVVDNFGFVPDHYITVKGEPFVELVDTLGGIEVDVQQDILDVPVGWSTFYSGTQTLDGQQTLDYVRILLPANTLLESLWERFERQNQVLQALLGASLQSENWSTLPELVKLVRRILVTDLSTNQADDLACMVEKYGSEAELIELPPEMVSVDEQGRLIPDLPAIQDMIINLGQVE